MNKNLNEVAIRIEHEGFHYAFLHYSSFPEIEDEMFHTLRKEYISAARNLQNYIEQNSDVDFLNF